MNLLQDESGNPATSLQYYSSVFNSLFKGSTGIKAVETGILPVTTLGQSCYVSMFEGCTGLTSLPESLLAAGTLAIYCYNSMFKGCTGLTSLPENLLPATWILDGCYKEMFSGCTSLTSAPKLPGEFLANYCYYQMFYNCSSLKVNENGSAGTSFFVCPYVECSYPVTDMFTGTGGTFAGTPSWDETYKYY